MAELISKVVRASNPINTAGNTLCTQGDTVKNTTPTHTTDSNRTHRDSGIASMDLGKDIDLSEQGLRRYSGLDYHEALRPVISSHRTSDMALADIVDDDDTTDDDDDDDGGGGVDETTSRGERGKK